MPRQREFHLDYEPLEYLIAALADGYVVESKSRESRIRNAHADITGERIVRVDEPDSDVAKKLFALMRADMQNRTNQHKPEFGGPSIESPEDEKRYAEKSIYALAKEIASGTGNELEHLYKRAGGNYNNQRIKADPEGYITALCDWAWNWDEEREHALQSDLQQVATILAKHGIRMDLDRAFWRLR